MTSANRITSSTIPFYSFSAVETFLQQASVDPHVVGIKMTLYRIGQKSPLDRPADRRGGRREAGGRAGRVEGEVRRAQQHPVGDPSRGSRRARRLRCGESENALQALPGRASGSGWRPALRAHRDRQLQSGHLAGLHGPGSVHRRSGGARRRLGDLQLPDRLLAADAFQSDAGRAGQLADAICGTASSARWRTPRPAGRPR